MKTLEFRNKFRRSMVILAVVFLLMFLFRLIYGYISMPNGYSPEQAGGSGILYENQPSSFAGDFHTQKNYATQQYKGAYKGEGSAVPRAVDVKYEKVANIESSSRNFADDEALVREEIAAYEGLIQYEWKGGNEGSRSMRLQIGVPPENFDSLYSSLTGIGNVLLRQITQTDKTNEYKKLNAQRASLEKTRVSLLELKTREGKIDELMGLEDRILAIEQQLQDLGVSLGDFDEENEFCTIEYDLSESKAPVRRHIGIFQRIKVALEWTIKFYLALAAVFVLMALFSLLILKILEKFKVIKKMMLHPDGES